MISEPGRPLFLDLTMIFWKSQTKPLRLPDSIAPVALDDPTPVAPQKSVETREKDRQRFFEAVKKLDAKAANDLLQKTNTALSPNECNGHQELALSVAFKRMEAASWKNMSQMTEVLLGKWANPFLEDQDRFRLCPLAHFIHYAPYFAKEWDNERVFGLFKRLINANPRAHSAPVWANEQGLSLYDLIAQSDFQEHIKPFMMAIVESYYMQSNPMHRAPSFVQSTVKTPTDAHKARLEAVLLDRGQEPPVQSIMESVSAVKDPDIMLDDEDDLSLISANLGSLLHDPLAEDDSHSTLISPPQRSSVLTKPFQPPRQPVLTKPFGGLSAETNYLCKKIDQQSEQIQALYENHSLEIDRLKRDFDQRMSQLERNLMMITDQNKGLLEQIGILAREAERTGFIRPAAEKTLADPYPTAQEHETRSASSKLKTLSDTEPRSVPKRRGMGGS